MCKFKRIIVLSITILLFFTFIVGGCKNDSGEKDEDGTRINFGDSELKYSEEKAYSGGVHVFNVSDGGKKLVTNETTEYEIVIPDNADSTIITASGELQNLLYEATKTWFEIKNENDVSSGVKAISLGNTEKSSEITVPDEVNSNGYVIKTIGDDLFIKAKDSHGVLWGVYEFLSKTVGYECVAYDTWYYSYTGGDVTLYDFDIVDSPDYELRISNNGVIYYNEVGSHKMRWLMPHKDVYIEGRGVDAYHNYFQFVKGDKKLSTVKDEHPLWFSDDGTQLCLSAHGDEEQRELLIQTVVSKMKELIDECPGRRVITFTQEDSPTWCNCRTCKKYYTKYKTDAGINVIFVNEVARRIKKWLDEECDGREVLISIFAYMKTFAAPSTKGVDGKYYPIDNDVICEDNVAVMIAPVYDQMAHGLDQSENAGVQDNILSWKGICKNFGYWGYCTYYTDDYNVMHNSFMATQNTYRYLLNNVSPAWIFDQGQTSSGNSTGFMHFKMYLQSQWQWDVNRDYRTLKSKFFSGYFGDASVYMEKFFDEYSTAVYNAMKGLNTGSNVWTTVLKTEYFPLGMLKGWLRYIDKAYGNIGKYKNSDPAFYQKLYEHIEIESLSVRYMLIKLYSGRFPASEAAKMKQSYEYDCSKYGIRKT